VVRVDAADTGSGVSDVELYVDGDYVTTSKSSVSPYEFTIPAGTLAPGTHQLKVTAADTLGNLIGTDWITIQVG